jgi:protein phosphatase
VRVSGRRRWPIVTTSLVVLLAVILGGGYIAWRVSQNQYYVATDSHGNVLIYRGINERILGIDLSSPFQSTSIPLDQVPSNDQQTIRTGYVSGNLAEVRNTVESIRTAIDQCKQQYIALQTWATEENRYQTEVRQASKADKPKIKKPPSQPPSAGATCAPSTAFGIPRNALSPSASS